MRTAAPVKRSNKASPFSSSRRARWTFAQIGCVKCVVRRRHFMSIDFALYEIGVGFAPFRRLNCKKPAGDVLFRFFEDVEKLRRFHHRIGPSRMSGGDLSCHGTRTLNHKRRGQFPC